MSHKTQTILSGTAEYFFAVFRLSFKVASHLCFSVKPLQSNVLKSCRDVKQSTVQSIEMWKVSGFSRFERRLLGLKGRSWSTCPARPYSDISHGKYCEYSGQSRPRCPTSAGFEWTLKYEFKTVQCHSLMLHWMRWCWGCVSLNLKGTRSMTRTWSRYPVSMIYLIWRGGVMIALRKDNIDLVSGSPARGALNACHFRLGFASPPCVRSTMPWRKGSIRLRSIHL